MRITDKKFLVKIDTINHEIFSGDAFFVKLTGGLGDMGFTPNHSPLLTTVMPGPVHVHTDDKVHVFHIMGGVAEVNPLSLTILADSALVLDNISLRMIKQDRDAALKAFASASDKKDLASIRAEIKKNDALIKSILDWQKAQ